MAGFSLRQALSIASSEMVRQGAAYPFRAAARVVRVKHPELRGPAYWMAVLAEVRRPKSPPRPPVESFTFLGPVQDVTMHPEGVYVHSTHGTLRVRALAPDLVQLRYRPDGEFTPPFSYSVARPEEDWPPVDLAVSEADEHITIDTGALRLVVERASGHLTLQDAQGCQIFEAGRGAVTHPESKQVIWQAQFPEETPFYGLGEKASGLNHAGRQFELWNQDPSGYTRGRDPIYMSVPFTMALVDGQAVGVFVDNSYRGWADFGTQTPGQFTYRAAGGELRVYLMAGSPARVLEKYTALTGRTRLPPLWAFGLHQSRWSYYPQERVLEIAKEFRERRLPCDVIHIDIHYMDGYRCFTWDRKRFPSLDRMADAMHDQGFRVLTMIDPGIKVDPGYTIYDQGVENDYFIEYPDGVRFTGPVWPGNCHFPDFTNPRVREWWGGLYKELLDSGIDAFWNDMNEPAIITGDPRLGQVPDMVQHDKEGLGATHDEIHNVYGLQMVRASVEGLQRLRPERRPLILSRSGWAGLQRYAIHWTGDNQSTWDHLALTIPMVANLGLSGIPITGPDTGGFTGGPTPELFARWMQMGAFTPFFRIHSMVGSPDQEPWAFGEEVEAISRKYLELRYRLLPYIYTAAWQAAQRGLPILRALAFEYPADKNTHNLDDQYLFGDGILVAPVLQEGGRERRVYLPGDDTWYDFWSGERHAGGQTVSVAAALDELPLFVRGGAVVPLWPVQQYVGEKAIDELELRAYLAPGEHISLLYEDDGVHPGYELPERHRLSQFVLEGRESGGRIVRETVSGEFPLAYGTTRLVIVGLSAEPGEVRVAGADLLDQTWDAAARTLTLRLRSEGDWQVNFV